MSIVQIRIADVVEAACELGELKHDEMVGPCRQKRIAVWRQRAYVAAYRITGKSTPQIGRFIGGRDHTTIIWALRKVEKGDAGLADGAMAVAVRAYEIASLRRDERVAA